MRSIYYGHDENGAFICGEDASGVTAYAYPTSEHAKAAVRNPIAVARQMLHDAALVAPFNAADADGRLINDRVRWAWLRAKGIA